MTIVFAGHFTVGEKIQPIQLKCIAAAQKLNGDIAILVNDLDVKRKIQFFDTGGQKMVIKHYGARKKCGANAQLCKLPEFDELPKLIDWNFYEEVLKTIKNSDQNINDVLRKNIIPHEIVKRLHEYGLDPEKTQVFTERELRNTASWRISNSKRNKPKSWRPMLESAGLLTNVKSSISNIPICGAIMLALFEKVALQGYTQIIQIDAEDDRYANENGTKLCRTLNQHFPADKRWTIAIENYYL